MTQPDDAGSLSNPSRELPPWRKDIRKAVLVFGITILGYFLVAYLALPLAWIHYAHRHPAIDEIPGITETGDDHPGDPVNLALVGSERELKSIMVAAGWYPADPITLKSCLEIAAGTVLRRPYDDAPVSALYLWERKQDLAFEQPVGNDPRRRHHVRFWKSKQQEQGRAIWAGAASFDERVGLSHSTGQITHHISPDVDAERDHVIATLKATGDLQSVDVIAGFHQILSGRNGGNDPWRTDGKLLAGTIKPLEDETDERAKSPALPSDSAGISAAE